jgi:hypothetical protein
MQSEKQQTKKTPSPLSVVANRLMFPFLFTESETKAALKKLMPATWETSEFSISLPDKLMDVHDTVLRYMVFYYDTDGIHTSVDDAKLALTKYVLDHTILPLDTINLLLCPKYLDTLFRLPKPFARIHNEYGFHDLEWHEQYILHLNDKMKQLDFHLHSMGRLNLTPPEPLTTYQLMMRFGANVKNIYTETAANFSEIYGMFAHRFNPGNTQADDQPQYAPPANAATDPLYATPPTYGNS